MEDNQSILNNLQIDQEGNNQLTETARWAKLFSVLGLSALALMVISLAVSWEIILKLLTSTQGSNPPAGVGTVLFMMVLLVTVIASILLLFILKGAIRIRRGLINKDQVLFNSGLSSLKNFFVMFGVITVLRFVFYLLQLI